ncbi:MAG: ATP-dependent DNA helicase PcrA, partial [Polyangia bacterium]
AEERRLAYVAITRAEERLFLTNARHRRLFGQDARPFVESRFLADIPDHCIARPVSQPKPRPQWMERPAREEPPYARKIERDSGISVEYDADAGGFDDVESTFRLGQRVRNPKFGEGEVRGFTGAGSELKLTVYFPSVGPKTIVARFVELV